MTTDLKMDGLDYNICVSVFFIPYIILGRSLSFASFSKSRHLLLYLY